MGIIAHAVGKPDAAEQFLRPLVNLPEDFLFSGEELGAFPGEKITGDILRYINYAKEKGCNMTGPADPDILCLNVLK